MNNCLIFQSSDNTISINSLYCIGGYTTYEVSISTGGFSGICNFCIKEKEIAEYLRIVDCMINNIKGEIEICDCESDAYLNFLFEDSNSLVVRGQIGGSHEDNTLKFKLKADQTILFNLQRALLDY